MTIDQGVDFGELRHDDDGRMWLAGKPFTGVAIERYPNGSKGSEISYRDGIEDGLSSSWYPNGMKESETMYTAGRVNGVHREWYENGQLKLEKTIETGYELKMMQWDETGKLVRSRG